MCLSSFARLASWHASCIPDAYLVHRSEGGKVENLDISIYISTFLTIMYTMYTMYTFLEKVCMMEVRESKKIKTLWYNFFFHLSSLTHSNRFFGGIHVYMVYMMTKWLNKHLFSHHFLDTSACLRGGKKTK